MRSIIAVTYLFLFLIFSLPVMLIALIVGLFSIKARDLMMLRFVQFGLYTVYRFIVGVKVTVNGLENIPEDEAVLFIGNHTSYFDIITTYPIMKRPTGFVAKKEIKKIPILPWVMHFVRCLFLDRENPRAGLQTILKAAEYIQDGISIVIFPEGTRSKDGTLGEFKEGSFKIATKAKCPVVPMGIIGTPDVFEKHTPWMKPAKVTINFGKPVSTAEMSRPEMKALPSMIREEVARLSGQESHSENTSEE